MKDPKATKKIMRKLYLVLVPDMMAVELGKQICVQEDMYEHGKSLYTGTTTSVQRGCEP